MYSFVGKTETGQRLKQLRGDKRQSDVAKTVNITRNALANFLSLLYNIIWLGIEELSLLVPSVFSLSAELLL